MKLKNRTFSKKILLTYSVIFILILLSTTLLSYQVFTNTTNESNKKLISETANQITYNYENYISDVLQVSEIIQEGIQNDDSSDLLNTANLFNTLLQMYKEIETIEIYDSVTGNLILSGIPLDVSSNVLNKDWFKLALSDDTIHFFNPLYEAPNGYFIEFSQVIPITADSRNKGVLYFKIDFSDILELSYKTNLGKNGHILIVDDSYNIVYSSLNVEIDINKEVNLLKEHVLGSTNYQTSTDDFIVNIGTITNTRWKIAVFYNINEVHETIQNFIILILILLLILLILGGIIIYVTTKHITNPLKHLEKNMSKVDFNGEVNLLDTTKGTAEIVSLKKTYNNMILQIKDLMDQVVIEQTAQRKSELKALQNQINPHFLYNTLDSIVWMIDNDQKEDAQNMIISLSKLFRISISRGNSIIPVRDEFEHVKNYLYIQSMRYKDAFSYKIEVSEECYKYKVMKLILQPLVENSIYHGLKNKIDEGHILIKGSIIDNHLHIEIIDDGYGISPEDIEKIMEKCQNPNLNDGVGLKNVYQRLHLYYGDDAYLKIQSEVDEYTKIILSIPVEEVAHEI